MHTLAPADLADLARRHGNPGTARFDWSVSEEEAAFVRLTQKGGVRANDVTLFICGPDGRVALIRKPNYPAGVWRNPGGGVEPGEDVAAAAVREALEETGLDIEVERYLLRAHPTFVPPGSAPIAWVTHVFTARSAATAVAPRDTKEITDCRWFAPADLTGPIKQAIMRTSRNLLHYRAWLHDACAAALAGAPLPDPAGYRP